MADDRDGDREHRIRQRAQKIWEDEGRPEGHHLRHWDSARREVEEEKSGLLHGSVDAASLSEESAPGDQPAFAQAETPAKSATRKRAGTPKRSG